MHPAVKTLSAACASALLVACADLGQLGRPPAASARGGLSADDAYVLARQQHLASRWPAAIDNYQAALRADPRHLNANNGLATLYAEQGLLPKAIGMWRELTVDAPDSAATAYIHSNLGYAYLLNGDYQLAIASLERACVLDPFNPRAWRHLGNALLKVGEESRAARMFKQADTLEKHDVRGDYATTGATPAAAVAAAAGDIDGVLARTSPNVPVAPDQVPPAPGKPGEPVPAMAAPEWPRIEIRQTGSAMFELRRPAAAPVPRRPAPEVAARQAPAPLATKPEEEVVEAPLRLEIRNGNGVNGMARGLSAALPDRATRVVRLSNQKGFGVEQTRVEYEQGYADAARRLADRFGGEAVETAMGGKVEMRLVLGRDVARSKSEARRVIRAALARAARSG